MNGEGPFRKNDTLTMIAVAALACILQDVLHEGLGHGVTAWLSGAHKITMSTVALQSDIDTRWIAANGTDGESCCGRNSLAAPSKSAALPTCDSRFPCLGNGWKSIHRNWILSFFGRGQLRRLEDRARRPTPSLGVACRINHARSCFLLRVDAAGHGETASISRNRPAQRALGVLDSLLHRRSSRGPCCPVQPVWTLLYDRVGAAVHSPVASAVKKVS